MDENSFTSVNTVLTTLRSAASASAAAAAAAAARSAVLESCTYTSAGEESFCIELGGVRGRDKD